LRSTTWPAAFAEFQSRESRAPLPSPFWFLKACRRGTLIASLEI
jgi:hypothetical protein